MKKRVGLSGIVFLMLFFFLAVSGAGAAALPENTTVQKWSGSAALPVVPGEADGLGKDPANSYAWSMAEYGEYIYVGTNRNFLKNLFVSLAGGAPSGMFPDDDDNRARIFRKLRSGSGDWEIFYTSPEVSITVDGGQAKNVPLDYGYRGMHVWNDALYIVSYSFFDSPYSRVLRLADPSGTGSDLEEVLRVENQGGSGLRSVISFGGALLIGTENLDVFRSADPRAQAAVTEPIPMISVSLPTGSTIFVTPGDLGGKDGWTSVANASDFPGVTPPENASGWGGIWDFAVYKDRLYVSIADPLNGFALYKTDGKFPETTKNLPPSPWAWIPIAAGGLKKAGVGAALEEPAGPAPLYPAGLGTYQNIALGLTEFNGTMYAGTFSNWKDILVALATSKSQEDLARNLAIILANWTPPQVYRFGEDDVWEMVVGDEGVLPGFDTRTSSWRAGFFPASDPAIINLSTNRYIWNMKVHKGHLFMGTMDMLPILIAFAESLEGTQYGTQVKLLLDSFTAGNSENPAGFDLFVTADGSDIQPVTLDGGFGETFGETASGDVGDFYNYGVRTLLSSGDDLFVGTANPFKGAQVWKLSAQEPAAGSGGGCSSQNAGIFALLLLLPLAFMAVKKSR